MSQYKSKYIVSEKSLKDCKEISKYVNKIIHGETLSTLQKMPDKSIDLIITSPSYYLGKQYEKDQVFKEYLNDHKTIISECSRVLKDDGAVFWNVAQSVNDGEIIHLGSLFYNLFKEFNYYLKNWIIWKFEGGETPRSRLFGRYENILWFVKDLKNYKFNIDDVRVPTKWLKDKRVRKDGKNPEDFWEFDMRNNLQKLEIMQKKLNSLKEIMHQNSDDYVNQIHMDIIFREMEQSIDSIIHTKDKIAKKNILDNIWHINRVVNVSKKQKIKHPISGKAHPCPFPEELITRIIKMGSNEGDIVLDIFAGSGTVFKVADELKRKWIGIDKELEYCEISDYRLSQMKGDLFK
jgi:adenine-specific DNA-methyltransferase